MVIFKNLSDQSLDILGTQNQSDQLDVSNEVLLLGESVVGQVGNSASIIGVAPDIIIDGISNIENNSLGNYITIDNAASPSNNGNYQIKEIINSTSVVIDNPNGVPGDANNGSISWVERYRFYAEDDHNYHRSDRANIKGVRYYEPIPQYISPSSGFFIDANLKNLSESIEYLDGYSTSPVTNVFGRIGEIVAEVNDYSSTLVENLSTVNGINVTEALNELKNLIVGGGGGTVSGPMSSNNNSIAVWNGTDGYTLSDSSIVIENSSELINVTNIKGFSPDENSDGYSVIISGGDGYGLSFGGDVIIEPGFGGSGSGIVSINGINNYGASVNDPVNPPPSSGDTYYNTILEEEMRYDQSRSKWLSVYGSNIQAGRNGNTNSGVFYRAVNGMVLDDNNRGIPVDKGTITSMSISRTDSDSATIEVLVNGIVVASFLSASAGFQKSIYNVNFEEGLMSFRNQAGGSQTSNVQINLIYKRRL